MCLLFRVLAFVLVGTIPALAADFSFTFKIDTKYCGSYTVSAFKCTDTSDRSWIDNVCYDSRRDMAILSLKGIGYCYCGMGANVYADFLKSPDLGVFYNAQIKGHFGCRGIDSRFPK
jgi:KTSC domain-containing protein